MRVNTGMAYKRRVRYNKVKKEMGERIFWRKRSYCGGGIFVGSSFDEYMENNPYTCQIVKKAGIYSKRAWHAGSSSTKRRAQMNYSYYSCRDIRNAEAALAAYEDSALSNITFNKSEAQRKAHNADRKAAKY